MDVVGTELAVRGQHRKFQRPRGIALDRTKLAHEYGQLGVWQCGVMRGLGDLVRRCQEVL